MDAKRVGTETMSRSGSTVWDQTTQTYHGGQDWKYLNNYKSDFSVTTNPLGTPEGAIEAACEALKKDALHYPAADFEPALTKLSEWLAEGVSESAEKLHSRLLLGNGLSELIDIITRLAPPGPWRSAPAFSSGGFPLQYKVRQE